MLHTLANMYKIYHLCHHSKLIQKFSLDVMSQLIKFTGNTGFFQLLCLITYVGEWLTYEQH